MSRETLARLAPGETTYDEVLNLCGPDPEEREQVTRSRTRATWELEQRAALYAQRKAQYKEGAATYTAWLKKNLGPVSSQTAQLMDNATVEMALQCEEQLIGLSEDLSKYAAEATRYAAQHEWLYQKKMSEH